MSSGATQVPFGVAAVPPPPLLGGVHAALLEINDDDDDESHRPCRAREKTLPALANRDTTQSSSGGNAKAHLQQQRDTGGDSDQKKPAAETNTGRKKSSRRSGETKKGCCCNWPDCRDIQGYLKVLSNGEDETTDARLGYNTIFVSRKDQMNGTRKFSIQKRLVLSSMVRHIGLSPSRLSIFRNSLDDNKKKRDGTGRKEEIGGSRGEKDAASEASMGQEVENKKDDRDDQRGSYFSVARHHYHTLLLGQENTRWTKPITAELAKRCGITEEDKIPGSDLYIRAPNFKRADLLAHLKSYPEVRSLIQEQKDSYWRNKTLRPANKMRPIALISSCGLVLPPFPELSRNTMLKRPQPQPPATETLKTKDSLEPTAVYGYKLEGYPKRGNGAWIGPNNNPNFDVCVHASSGLLFTTRDKLLQSQAALQSWVAQAGWIHCIRAHRAIRQRRGDMNDDERVCMGLQSDYVRDYANRGNSQLAFCALRWCKFRNVWRAQDCSLVAEQTPSHGLQDEKPRCLECYTEFQEITKTNYPEMFVCRAATQKQNKRRITEPQSFPGSAAAREAKRARETQKQTKNSDGSPAAKLLE